VWSIPKHAAQFIDLLHRSGDDESSNIPVFDRGAHAGHRSPTGSVRISATRGAAPLSLGADRHLCGTSRYNIAICARFQRGNSRADKRRDHVRPGPF
jgi:hypothetical protein